MKCKVTYLLGIITVCIINVIHAQQTFTNPLLPSGADPWCIYKNGYYYYTNTTGRNITIWKSTNIGDLAIAEKKTVWTPPSAGAYSRNIWAPEVHFLNDKWYVYFAADGGKNADHRLYVLENESADPLKGTWTFKGKLETPEDKWSIDGSVFENRGILYLIWSGWKGDEDGEQDIYIAKMKNPWTVEGKRILISSPQHQWETIGDINNANDVRHVNVNEGPQILKHKDKLYLVYSASGCWTDTYALGMLTAPADADLLHPSAWKKTARPVFQQSLKNKVYATGHNSFFSSPDGKENYILYHANSEPGQGCGQLRSPRAQRFTWNKDGTPNFGEPVAEGVKLPVPTGLRVGVNKHNPVLDIDFPDPTVIKVKDTYYAYATQGSDKGHLNNIQVASSKDLFNWEYRGDALPQKPMWANNTQDFWAPHVLYDSLMNQYVMFYCAKSNDTLFDKCIGVAFSNKPQGPFTDKGSPLIQGKGFADIDPMALVDPQTGKKLLYWGSGFAPIRVRELNDDWKSFKEGSIEVPLVFPGKDKNYSNLIEGAWVDVHEGKYYLYYSGDNCCGSRANYAVMVARANNAFGPFERLGEVNKSGSSVILEKDSTWNAPGHNSIVHDDKGRILIVYHASWRNKEQAGIPRGMDKYLKRVMCVEPVLYEHGWPHVVMKY